MQKNNVQCVIMSDGKGSRWNNYLGLSKQEIYINNETILERTVRLLREIGYENIKIVSHNPRHNVEGVERIYSDYDNQKFNQYAYDFLNTETIYLYGDTYYSKEALISIMESKVYDVNFCGTNKCIIAIKVKDTNLFKGLVTNFDDSSQSIYHAFDNIKFGGEEIYRYVYIYDWFYNINTPEDYNELITLVEEKVNQKSLRKEKRK